jgi:trigger factor
VTFDATVEIRPQVVVPGYGGLRVELPRITVTDDEVQAAIDAELRRHGELADVERPALTGDYLTIDIEAERDGDPVPGLNTDDWGYELGRGWVAPDFDEQLAGALAGDTLTFTTTPTGTEDPADFTVSVAKVQELIPAELDDEWVAEQIGEYDTEAEWRRALRERMESVKLNTARQMLLDRAATAVAGLVEEEPPEPLVNDELRSRAENLVNSLQAQGIAMEQYLAMTGQDPASLTEGLKSGAEQAVKVDLALRSIAESEGLEVTDDDLEAEYQRIGVRVNQKPNQVRKAYERNDAVSSLRGEIRKSKAMEWLLHNVEIVDEDGTPIDRDLLLPPDADEHDPDHDNDGHDHDAHDAHGHADEPPNEQPAEEAQ